MLMFSVASQGTERLWEPERCMSVPERRTVPVALGEWFANVNCERAWAGPGPEPVSGEVPFEEEAEVAWMRGVMRRRMVVDFRCILGGGFEVGLCKLL